MAVAFLHTYYRTIGRCLWALLLVMACSSCITNKSNNMLQTDSKLPQYPKAEYNYYRIQKNDRLVLRILTLNNEAASIFSMGNSGMPSGSNQRSYRVYDDGTIDIPFVNQIPVVGLTLREAAHAIEQQLKDFVPDAMVKVALANDMFYIISDGAKGAYKLYKEKLNIFQALAVAGNLATNSDKKRVRVIRPVNGKPQIREFDLRTASIIDSEYYYVQPNDVIYVSSIKGNFWKIDNYTSTLGTFTTSINFLVSVINLGLTSW